MSVRRKTENGYEFVDRASSKGDRTYNLLQPIGLQLGVRARQPEARAAL